MRAAGIAATARAIAAITTAITAGSNGAIITTMAGTVIVTSTTVAGTEIVTTRRAFSATTENHTFRSQKKRALK